MGNARVKKRSKRDKSKISNFKNKFIYGDIAIKIISLIFMVVLLVALISIVNTDSKPSLDTTKTIDLFFLNLTDADSTIIRSKDKTILIDTGLEEDFKLIDEKLEYLGVKTIDYLILTHPDKDHIGSASALVTKYNIGQIYQSHFKKGSDIQVELDNIIELKGIKNNIVIEVEEVYIDELKIKIIPGKLANYTKDNDYSLVTLISYYNNNVLMAADIEETRIDELLKLNIGKVDILKVPHHGRYNYLSLNLLDTLNPEYAIVTSASANNKIVNFFQKIKTLVFYTPNGEINIKLDGYRIDASQRGIYE